MANLNTKKRSASEIVGIIVIAVLALAVVFTFVLYGMFKDTNSAPTIFGNRVYIMNGDKMEPRIEKGAAVFVKEGLFPEKPGNVILCEIDGQLAVVGYLGSEEIINPDGTVETRYIVKYDQAPAEEKWGVGKEDIIGKATTYSNFFGALVTFASSKAGMLCVVIIPCAVVLIYEVVMFVLSLKKKGVKKEKKPQKTEEELDAESLRLEIERAKRSLEQSSKKKTQPVVAEPKAKIDDAPIREARPVQPVSTETKRTFDQPKPEQKLAFTSTSEPEEKPANSRNLFLDDEPIRKAEKPVSTDETKIIVDDVPLREAKPREKSESTIKISEDPKPSESLSGKMNLSQIDELIKMLEEEKKRMSEKNQ